MQEAEMVVLRSMVRSQLRREIRGEGLEHWVQELVRLLEEKGGADLLLEVAGVDPVEFARRKQALGIVGG